MANVKIVFDSGNETELALPDAIGARLVTAFAKFTQGGEAPTTRFKVDEASSFFRRLPQGLYGHERRARRRPDQFGPPQQTRLITLSGRSCAC